MKFSVEFDSVEFKSLAEFKQFLANWMGDAFTTSRSVESVNSPPILSPTPILTEQEGKVGGKRANAGRKPKIRIADPHSPTPIICSQCGEKVVGEYVIKKHKILCKTCQNENIPYPDPYLYSHPVPQVG